MRNSKRAFAPDPDDVYSSTTGDEKIDAETGKEEIKPALPKEAEAQDKKRWSFKDMLQQWSNNDAADSAFDDTRV
jgi:hypothetical protein